MIAVGIRAMDTNETKPPGRHWFACQHGRRRTGFFSASMLYGFYGVSSKRLGVSAVPFMHLG